MGDWPDHLHFELRVVMNAAVSNDWHRINTEPVDPLPFMYPWEKIFFEQIQGDTPETQGPEVPLQEAGVLRKRRGVPMYQVRWNGNLYHIPLYYLDPGDRRLVALLQDAYMFRKPARLAFWESHFFEGFRIIRTTRIVG